MSDTPPIEFAFPELRRWARYWRVLPIVRFLAGSDPHHANRVADHVGRALLSSWSLGHFSHYLCKLSLFTPLRNEPLKRQLD